MKLFNCAIVFFFFFLPKNISYGSYTKLMDDNKLGRPGKLSCFNELILVCMKLQLDLFNWDIGNHCKVCESTKI